MNDNFTPAYALINPAHKRPRHESEINDALALGLPSTTKRGLLLAPYLEGTGADAVLLENLTSADEVDDACGVVARALAEMIFAANPAAAIDVLPLAAAGAGVVASGTITFATNAAADGVISLFFGGREIQVSITSGMTAAQIATAARAALVADTKCEWTADEPSTGEMTYKHKFKGTIGNYTRIAAVVPADMATTATVVQPSSGATDPTFSSTVAGKFTGRDYDAVIVPWRLASTSLTALKAAAVAMRTPSKIIDARFFVGIRDTYANAVTYQEGVENRDFVIVWSKAAALYPTPPHLAAAYEAGVFLAEGNPAVPFIEDKRPDLPAPFETGAVEPTDAEIENCMSHGLTVQRLDGAGVVETVQMLTAATKLSSGVESDAWSSVHIPQTLKYTRKAIDARLRATYNTREKRRLIPGAMAGVKGLVLAVLDDLAAAPLYYLDGDYLKQNRDKIVVRASAGNVRFLEIGIPAPVIPEFRGTLTTIFLVIATPQS